MGVAHHAAGHLVDVPQQQVGGFPPHTGQPQQLFHGAWDLAAKIGEQHLAGQYNISGLVLVKPAGAHIVFHIPDVRVCHGFQGGIGSEQGGGDLIDPGVGALGGEPDGDHQLIVLVILQSANRIGIALLQSLNNGGYFFFHRKFLFVSVL